MVWCSTLSQHSVPSVGAGLSFDFHDFRGWALASIPKMAVLVSFNRMPLMSGKHLGVLI